MRLGSRPSPFSSSSDIVMKKDPSFSTVTEPTYSSGPRGGQVLDDEVSSTTDHSSSASHEMDIDSMSLTRAHLDGDSTSGNTNPNPNINIVDNLAPRSSSAHVLADAGALAIEDADDSMLLPSLRTNTDINTSAKSRTHIKVNQKHKSLGAIPLRHLSTPLPPLSSEGNNGGQRRAGALRHLSLMRKERDRGDPRYNSGRGTPSFLDSIVRSVSPTPQSLSSDPTKIIGAQGLRSASAKKSFSLDSFGQRSRPKTVSEAFKSAKTSDSLAWRPSANAPTNTTTTTINGMSISPSNSRASGIDALIPDRTDNYNNMVPKSPRSQNLSSTSLRRVLSLGRPRLDSDAYSAVSEPIVYADSAHVADDIWIAPKELYESERRLAANNERRKKEKEMLALKLAEQRKISHLNRNIEINSVLPEMMSNPRKSNTNSNNNTNNSRIAPVKYSFRTTTPDSSGTGASINTLRGVRKQAEYSTASNTTSNSPSSNMHVDLMDIDEPSQKNLRLHRDINNKGPGGAERHSSLPAAAAGDREYNSMQYNDPYEFNNADMSSRLIRLFFNSGSQNPMPPTATKRNADLQSRSVGGSSRRLLFRRHNNINNTDRQYSSNNYINNNNSGTLRSGSSGSNMNMRKNINIPNNNIGHRYDNNINPNVESMSHDFDLKGRMRGIARIANVRRWLRSRAYRKRRPERRPREVPV